MKNICLPSFFFYKQARKTNAIFFFFTMIEYTKMIIFGRLSKEQKKNYLRKKKAKVCFVKIWVCRFNEPFDFNKNLI